MISLSGPIETRVFDFLRTRAAIKLEGNGIKVGKGSLLNAARSKGYVPSELISRGNILRRRDAALRYMDYVATLLTQGQGSFPCLFAEEIVMGKLVYSETDECGCPAFMPAKDQTNRVGLLPLEQAMMCIGHDGSEG